MPAPSPYDTPPRGDFAAYVERLSATPAQLRSALPASIDAPSEQGGIAQAAKRLRQALEQAQQEAAKAKREQDPVKGPAEAGGQHKARSAQRAAAGDGSARAGKVRTPASAPAKSTKNAPAQADTPADEKSGGVNPIKYFVLPLIAYLVFEFGLVEPPFDQFKVPILAILTARGVWLLLRDVVAEVRRRQRVAGVDAGSD